MRPTHQIVAWISTSINVGNLKESYVCSIFNWFMSFFFSSRYIHKISDHLNHFDLNLCCACIKMLYTYIYECFTLILLENFEQTKSKLNGEIKILKLRFFVFFSLITHTEISLANSTNTNRTNHNGYFFLFSSSTHMGLETFHLLDHTI